ncbi:MAG: glutathione S-transferase family protein [Pseudomonadales bacterium]
MKLYKVALAPNPTKVMLYIAERNDLGAALDLEQITVNTLKGEQRSPEHLARNPFGTLPVLEIDPDHFLLESLSIIHYLEEKFPDHALVTGAPEHKAHAWDVERIVDVRFASLMARYVHAVNSPLGLPQDPELARQLLDEMQTPLNFLEQQLSDHRSLLLGEQVSIADCTLQAAFQFMRFAEADVLGERPLLRAWDERYRTRPAATQVLKW